MTLMFTGLGALIIGNGFFKPNISTMVGDLYAPQDHRKDSAFTIFYMGINTGALIAPLVCGSVAADGEALEWVTVAVRDASGKIYDGTTTDALGAFKLNAAGGSELYFSLLGYKDVVVKELSNDMCVRM